MAVKDMGASVLTRLKKQAKETGINYQTCLQLFAQEEFLRKLEMSRYAENLVLKGGMFLYTISNYEGRPTMDIDFMLRRMSNDVAGMETIMEEICQTETHNDFITMEVLGTREITPEKKYPGIGINLMAHIKNVRIPFSVDIGVDDVIVPQIRNISAIHYEPDALYFFTARGKNFCKELMEDGRVQILAYTKYKEMIRLSGKAYAVAENEQKKWMDIIFEEQPYLANVYPGDTREIGIIFCIDKAEVEYFNLGVNPIFRETYILGNVSVKEKEYYITESCIGCGKCMKHCPQKCIEKGTPFVIRQEHCLHCGNCYENCPVKAVIRK